MVLKLLEDAIRDGDHIYASVRPQLLLFRQCWERFPDHGAAVVCLLDVVWVAVDSRHGN